MLIRIINIIKVIILSFVEGISEWLPISSSGHMLLVDEFIKLDVSESFKELFFVLIQLGAVVAVIVTFFNRINPFCINEKKIVVNKNVLSIWFKIVIACIPGGIVTLLFDDYIEKTLHTPIVISLMLILYGVIFILIEKYNQDKINKHEITYKSALLIGLFQVLSIIPGTSRSGATIIGGLLIGINRLKITEFSFYLAIPVMFGFSLIKLIKFGLIFTFEELLLLTIGMLSSFLISLLVVKFLLQYVKKHDFKIFGVYRIILGLIMLIYFVSL